MHESFVRLMRYGGNQFRQADSQLAFLYIIAERVCFDKLKQRRRTSLNVNSDELVTHHGPEGGLEDRDLAIRYLEPLDERTRRVALLHYVDEMTQEEIATYTGWTRRTVGKKLKQLQDRGEKWLVRLKRGDT